MSFDLNITVNGSRCKQYYHQGKIFIQANPGSEYSIEIKNNHWKRILAVSSVDGLNVLTGKSANELDSGYIINGYSSEKIKGFRFSDNEWALFKFGYKFNGKTYAQSKNDGSEQNCGVIGVRLFYEKELVWTTTYTSYPYQYGNSSGVISGSGISYTSNVNYCANNHLGDNLDMKLMSSIGTGICVSNVAGKITNCCANYSAQVEQPQLEIGRAHV